MKFERLSKEEYLQTLDEYEKYLAALEVFKTTVDSTVKWVKGKYSVYDLISNIEKVMANRDTFIREQNCMHHRSSGLTYTGHDSHKDHYEDKCLDCGVVLEYDSV